jgi:two-component system C4-dicarboxylate transport response regulator DctD
MSEERPQEVRSLRERVEVFERRLIEEALAASGGNQRRAAAALGVLPTTLHEKMRRLGLTYGRRNATPLPDSAAAAEAAQPR